MTKGNRKLLEGDGPQDNAKAARLSGEGIDYDQAVDAPAGLRIFGQQPVAIGRKGRRYDQYIAEVESVRAGEIKCVQDVLRWEIGSVLRPFRRTQSRIPCILPYAFSESTLVLDRTLVEPLSIRSALDRRQG